MHEKDIDAWAALWNPDANIFVPYPPHGFPGTISGKEQIVPGFRDLFAHFGAYYFDPRTWRACSEYVSFSILRGTQLQSTGGS